MQSVTARTRALIVATVLILAISIIVPVSAKKTPYYKASGTIDSYVDVWSSEIVSGRWSVTIKKGVLQYKAMFRELNLYEGEPEYSPIGSIDIFMQTFTTDTFDLTSDRLIFSGKLQFKKIWKKLDGTTEIKRGDTAPVIITVTPNSFLLDYPPEGPGNGIYNQDWDRTGTTTHFK